MFNKKGQEGVTLTTLLLIVLGVVVVVVIILGVTGFFDKIFGGADEVLPSKLEAATQACKIAASAGLTNDYCYRFREIGENIYANCEYPIINNALESNEIDCSDDVLLQNAKKEFCEGKDDENVKVNGEICLDMLGNQGPPAP